MHTDDHLRGERFDESAFEKSNHAAWRLSRHARFFHAAFALLFALGAVAVADESQWRVWLEPKFMRAPVATPLAEAQKTELAAGLLTPDGLATFTAAEFGDLAVSRELFHSVATLNTAYDLPHLRFRFERDRRQVIRYAVIESDRPLVASAVMFPGFLDLWKETLGERVLIVIPSRFKAFLFPKLATDYLDYAPMVFRAYRETPYPVSVEVFELGPEGWRCIGAYAEP